MNANTYKTTHATNRRLVSWHADAGWRLWSLGVIPGTYTGSKRFEDRDALLEAVGAAEIKGLAVEFHPSFYSREAAVEAEAREWLAGQAQA